jgi:hypothetical protein
MKKGLFTFIAFLLSIQLLSQLNSKNITFYCPPFLSIELDTSEWIVPYEKPCYLYANSPFEFKSSFDITHKSQGLRFRLYCLYDRTTSAYRGKYISENYGLDSSETSILKGYTVFLNSNNGSIYLADTVSDYGYAMIETNCKLSDTLLLAKLTSTLQNLKYVSPKEIDQLVGYPYNSKTDIQKIRNQRVLELRRNLRNGLITQMYKLYQDPVDSVFFDFFFMRDRLQEYSFDRYHKLRMQDCKGNYSLDEHLNFMISEGKHPDDLFLAEYAGADLIERKNYADFELMKLLSPEKKMKTIGVLDMDTRDSIIHFFSTDALNWELTRTSKRQSEWDTQRVSGMVKYTTLGTRSLNVGVKSKPNFDFNYFRNDRSIVLVSSVLNHSKETFYQLREGRFVINLNSKELNIAYMDFEKFPSKADYIFEVRGSDYCGLKMADRTAGFSEFYEDSLRHFHYNVLEVVDPPKRTVIKVSNDRLQKFPVKNPAVLSPVYYTNLGDFGNSCWQVLLYNNEILDYCIYENGPDGWEKKEGSEWKKKLEVQEEVSVLKEFFYKNEFDVALRAAEDKTEFEISTIPYYSAGLEALILEIKKNTIYPKDLNTECLFGRMEVSFLLDANGFVQDVRIERNETGHEELEASVLLAMKEIRSFVPATLQERNVESRLKVIISY